MKRCVIIIGDEHVNIAADEIAVNDEYLTVWNGDAMVGVFRLGTFDRAYISEQNK